MSGLEQIGPTVELAFLCAVLEHAGDELIRWGDDVDGKILKAHAAQMLRGQEWPGDPIVKSTFDFEGSDDPRLMFRDRKRDTGGAPSDGVA